VCGRPAHDTSVEAAALATNRAENFVQSPFTHATAYAVLMHLIRTGQGPQYLTDCVSIVSKEGEKIRIKVD